MSIIPAHRPVLAAMPALATVDRVILADKNADGARIIGDCSVYVLAIRDPKQGTYNDIIAAVFRSGREPVVCNGNTDPSRFGASSTAPGKDMARLVPGVIPMVRGHHRDWPHCFRMVSEAHAAALGLDLYFQDYRKTGAQKVERMHDAEHGKIDIGHFACNLHPGGDHSTTSAGCLTIPQPQYDELRDAVYAEMDMQRQAWLPIVLVEGPV
jgi:hypothetical protein